MSTDAYGFRFYEPVFPKEDELVVVRVEKRTDVGAFVSLLEYGKLEGMILMTELSRKRIRSVKKLISVGKTEIVHVLRVDQEKRYIDLSKKRVDAEDVAKCEERFEKAKMVQSILNHISHHSKEKADREYSMEELCNMISWPLYRSHEHAYDVFIRSLRSPEVLDELKLEPKLLQLLLEEIAKRLKAKPFKFRADIDVTCFSYRGVEAVREALTAGEDISEGDLKIQVCLIAPPQYAMIAHHPDKAFAVEKMKSAIDKIREVIKKDNGACEVRREPFLVSDMEDKKLKSLLKSLDDENAEDDEEEDDDDEDDGKEELEE